MADEIRDKIGDPELSRRYRELPREEPGQDLDAAILAAARRAAETRPAPLVPPTARRRWYFPLAAAAVLVLAVAVTVQVERNRPDVDGLTAPSPASTAVPAPAQQALPQAPSPKPSPRAKDAPRAESGAPKTEAAQALKEEQTQTQAPADASQRRDMASERQNLAGGVAGALPEERAPAAPAAAMAPQMQARALAKIETPERALERIAELRRQGRDEDADKALAEFRKRYPEFRISEEMLKKVERR